MIGVWCTPEINKAVECGYKILKVYEVYHWDKTAQYNPDSKEGGLFSDFINQFLKIKQEASGWPKWCETPDQQQQYITDYFKNEGIKLDRRQIEYNAGRRSLAKLILNR